MPRRVVAGCFIGAKGELLYLLRAEGGDESMIAVGRRRKDALAKMPFRFQCPTDASFFAFRPLIFASALEPLQAPFKQLLEAHSSASQPVPNEMPFTRTSTPLRRRFC